MSPPRTKALLAGGCLAAALLGCEEIDVRDGPDLEIQLLDREQGCHRTCGAAQVAPEVASLVGEEPECPTTGTAEPECVFSGGSDRIRVIADYGDLAFASCGKVADPTLSVLVEDAGPTDIGAMVPGCGPDRRYFAYRTLTAPISESPSVRFRVTSGDAFLALSEPFRLTPAQLDLRVEACLHDGTPPPDCELVAGVRQTVITIRAPRDLAVPNDMARLTYSTGAGTFNEVDVQLKVTEDHREGSYKLTMPSEPGETLTIDAAAGSLVAPTQTVTLVPAGPLQLSAAVPVAEPSALPRIAAGEPEADCRKIAVTVSAPDGVPGDQVLVQASQGTFENGGNQITKSLFPNGALEQAITHLQLPKSPASQSVSLLASEAGAGGTVPPAFLSFELERIWPIAASLATATKQAALTDKGAPEVVIKGTALPPKTGAVLQPDTIVHVVVTATADPTVALPCGTPVSEEDLRCDATKPGELPGGCLLSPATVALGTQGAFEIKLSAGICFAGTVGVDVYSPTYETSDELCLADRAVTDLPSRLTTGPVLAIQYKPNAP